MIDTLFYRERLPKYVFNGTQFTRGSIRAIQAIYRIVALLLILAILYLLVIYKSQDKVNSSLALWIGIAAMLIGSAILLFMSERVYRAQLDGHSPTVINEDRISLPPRMHRKLTGESDFVHRGDINHIKVVRGRGAQYLAKKNGVLWKDAPIGLEIVTTTGKKFRLGYKPPSTVKEITNILTTRWNIRVEDTEDGMGMGLRYIDDQVVGEYSYDEIMRMNLFEWQQ